MSYPDAPVTRLETYLARLAGQDVSIPDTPITRIEEYLAHMIGGGGGVPAPSAGAHNGIFRGKSLGTSYTSAQADAINAGTFDDLFVGDYWTINDKVYRIAGFDLFLGIGNSAPLTKHHAVIVPDAGLDTATMNDTAGMIAYSATTLFLSTLPAVDAIVEADFGDGAIIAHDTLPVRTVNPETGQPSAWTWVSLKCDLMSCEQIVGLVIRAGTIFSFGLHYSQFPLFALSPECIRTENEGYWTQTINPITTGGSYMYVADKGYLYYNGPTAQYKVRPYFLVGKAS